MTQCPCGSGADLDACCGPIVRGERPAPTAKALMRSRYTAFVRGDLDHIDRTHAREMRDRASRPTDAGAFKSIDWVGLEIFGTTRGGENDDTGTVDFAAHYRQGGQIRVHRERSNFRREDGRWVYVDGAISPDTSLGRVGKIGRNAPCPCGSGKKFKKCCGAQDNI